MKRSRLETFPTIWEAAHVTKHFTFQKWIESNRLLKNHTGHDEDGIYPGVTSTHIFHLRDELKGKVNPATTNKKRKMEMGVGSKKKLPQLQDKIMTTFQLGIVPTIQQRTIMKKMIEVNNIIFNWCNYLVKNGHIAQTNCNMITLQNIVNRDNILEEGEVYVEPSQTEKRKYSKKGVPVALVPDFARRLYTSIYKGLSVIKAYAIKEYVGSLMVARKRRKQSHKEEVRTAIGLKDRKINNLYFGSFGFTKKTIKIEPKSTARPGRLSFLPKFFGKEHEGIKLSRCTKPIPPLDHDVHFELRKDNKWVIHIPCDSKYTRRAKTKTTYEKDAVCSIDPGCKIFLSVFDATRKETYELGVEEQKAPIRLLRKKAKLYSSKIKDNQENEKKSHRFWYEVKKKVRTVHDAIIHHLKSNYTLVILGDMKVREIINRMRGYFPKDQKDELLTWSYRTFISRLLFASKGTQCKVVLQDESHTTQTCGRCNEKLTVRSSRIVHCKHCFYETDRDVNGARNILRKFANMLCL